MQNRHHVVSIPGRLALPEAVWFWAVGRDVRASLIYVDDVAEVLRAF